MIRLVVVAVRSCPTNRTRFLTIPHRTTASKEKAQKLEIPPALAESSKMLLNTLQEIYESNEVKLVRLTTFKILEESQKLFRTYVLENPSFHESLKKFQSTIENMQEVAEREAKGGAAKVEKVASAVKTAAKDTKDKIAKELPKSDKKK